MLKAFILTSRKEETSKNIYGGILVLAKKKKYFWQNEMSALIILSEVWPFFFALSDWNADNSIPGAEKSNGKERIKFKDRKQPGKKLENQRRLQRQKFDPPQERDLFKWADKQSLHDS